MGKFSDPNYKLLKDYFDILVAVRTGTQKSFLIGPNKTVVSEGGLWSILYENNATRGYVGHRFKIVEIDGNRFKMTYEGLESTFSIASSAFDISNEMYFRKDSFFHYWFCNFCDIISKSVLERILLFKWCAYYPRRNFNISKSKRTKTRSSKKGIKKSVVFR